MASYVVNPAAMGTPPQLAALKQAAEVEP